MWTELETARDTLAEIQALLCEVGGAEWAESEADTAGSDDYLTSLQWLKVRAAAYKTAIIFIIRALSVCVVARSHEQKASV